MVTVHDLYRNMGNANVCTEFRLLDVKVSIVFLATVGFSPSRDGRYILQRWAIAQCVLDIHVLEYSDVFLAGACKRHTAITFFVTIGRSAVKIHEKVSSNNYYFQCL